MNSDIFYVNKEIVRDPNKHLLSFFQSIPYDQLNNDKTSVILTVYVTNSYTKHYHKFILPTRLNSEMTRLSFNDIMDGIATYEHVKLDNCAISYRINNEKLISFSEDESSMIMFYVGKYPLNENYLIEIPKDKIVYINLRPIVNKGDQLRLELYEEEAETQEENKVKQYFVNEKSKRAKERKIGDVIKKVYLWKKLYEGVNDRDGKLIKMTLQDAAEKVDISKKSLDEYFNQIKLGKHFRFDFNKHRNDKVGVLRGFVKTQMQMQNQGMNVDVVNVNNCQLLQEGLNGKAMKMKNKKKETK